MADEPEPERRSLHLLGQMRLLPHGEVWAGKAATTAAALLLAAAVAALIWTLLQRFRAVERLLAAFLCHKLFGVHLERYIVNCNGAD
eukprot:jgi/Chlat1/1461/Chrsp12S02067